MPGSTEFVWTLALLATVTVTVTTQVAHYQLLLIPALLVLAASGSATDGMGFLVRALRKGPFACLFWQWGTALVLALCSTFAPASTLEKIADIPLYTSLALPVVTLVVVSAVAFRPNHQREPMVLS